MKTVGDIEKELIFSKEGTYKTHRFTGIKKSYVKFRRLFVNLLITENYEQLAKELKSHTPQDIKSFFLEEGDFLLVQAIAASNIQPLTFLVDNIPFEAIRGVLDKGFPKILKNFLYAQKRREEQGENSFERRNLMMEKLKLFLKISPTEVQKLMDDATAISDCITTTIKEDYQTALAQLNKKNTTKSYQPFLNI